MQLVANHDQTVEGRPVKKDEEFTATADLGKALIAAKAATEAQTKK